MSRHVKNASFLSTLGNDPFPMFERRTSITGALANARPLKLPTTQMSRHTRTAVLLALRETLRHLAGALVLVGLTLSLQSHKLPTTKNFKII